MAHHRGRRRNRPAVEAQGLPQEKRRASLVRRAVHALELPADIGSGMAHIELSGNREAVVEGCCGVLEYDENVIRLNVGDAVLRLCGRGLGIRSLTADSVVIEGFILSLEYQF